MKIILILLLMGISIPGLSAIKKDSQARIQALLAAWDKDPKSVMNTLPKKYNEDGSVNSQKLSVFRSEDIRSGRYREIKVAARKKFISRFLISAFSGDRIATDPTNDPRPMLLKSQQFSIHQLGDAKFLSGKVETNPWSGDYFALYRGGIAVRYEDSLFPSTTTWSLYEDFFKKAFSTSLSSLRNLDDLSPAEKYDILVGDSQWTMTRWSLEESKRSAVDGTIETWMGLCHGWAPASYMTNEPLKQLTFKLPSGQNLVFFPADIKALMTLLWANVDVPTVFVGSRCNEKNPATDTVTGRILSGACWDINPMTWHLTMLNRLGADRSSFVMDATWDFQVWNQPVQSYEITYFNPETRQTSKVAKDVAIRLSQFTKNKFPKRSPGTEMIVGVMMDTTYVAENSASHSESPGNRTMTVEYIYDLEMDRSGKILGGEWYQNAHPDFIWSPAKNAIPISWIEKQNPVRWNAPALPDSQVSAVAIAGSELGNPLNAIVYKLFELSAARP